MKQGEIKGLFLAPIRPLLMTAVQRHGGAGKRDGVLLVIFLLYNNIPYVHNPYYYNPSMSTYYATYRMGRVLFS